jgi:high-affinity Fe2+/Pb2+ permease
MNPLMIETFLSLLVVVYVFMGGVFMFSQAKGKSFLASFDKAFVWGTGFFVISYGLNAAAYAAWS